MLTQILDWAVREERIRVLLMVGSRAISGRSDELSDYDISVFGHYDAFRENDDWLNSIHPYSICIHDEFFLGTSQIPTRLVIFSNGKKVDFAFHPFILLENMISNQKLFPDLHAGYQVILDKENCTHLLPAASFEAFIIRSPSEAEFITAVKEFWFEAYHVAKYLHRKDIWVAKFRDDAMKKWLLIMLEWNAAACSRFPVSVKPNGKNIREWIQDKYYKKLKKCFFVWKAASGRKALFETMGLFREIALETALNLNYSFDTKAGDQISIFIGRILSYPKK